MALVCGWSFVKHDATSWTVTHLDPLSFVTSASCLATLGPSILSWSSRRSVSSSPGSWKASRLTLLPSAALITALSRFVASFVLAWSNLLPSSVGVTSIASKKLRRRSTPEKHPDILAAPSKQNPAMRSMGMFSLKKTSLMQLRRVSPVLSSAKIPKTQCEAQSCCQHISDCTRTAQWC